MVKIFTAHGFRGTASGKKWLAPGTHDVDESLAAYMVENGHAVYVSADTDTGLTQKEHLILEAQGLGIEVDRRWTMQEIQRQITAQKDVPQHEALIAATPAFDPLPEITEDPETEERPSSPVSRNKKRK